MPPPNESFLQSLPRNLVSGLVVFLVALPLCLGVALASRADAEAGGHGLFGEAKDARSEAKAKAAIPDDKNVPLFAGLIAGVVGGILVGTLSGSHTSVSGPAAGLTAVVSAQVMNLGSFQTFLLALVLAGVFQVALGVLRLGFLAKYFPNSVIKGLLAAIGVLLVLKQIPHVVGHDKDPEGDFSFFQPDQKNTFTELIDTLTDFQPGALAIGLVSLALLMAWDRVKALKGSVVPAPLVVVLLGVALAEFFKWLGWTTGGPWAVEPSHLVSVPAGDSPAAVLGFLQSPDWGQWANPAVYSAAVVIAVVASLETLINLEAVDRIDPKQRNSPSSRELVAQGVGNVTCGLIGGLPVTSVIVRSSVNINAGGRSKLSAIWHGVLLAVCVVFAAAYLNMIPLSCLAAILIVTGLKLASPKLVKQMWREGRQQFVPFAATVLAIVFTDLLIGVVVGLLVSVAFILWSNVRRPLERVVERHLGGEVVRINLANQVSFLNRAALAKALDEVPAGGHLLLDATRTDYIDPDILDLIHEYQDVTAPARGVQVSLRGFQQKYTQLQDRTLFVDYSSREVQSALTPAMVLQVLKDGNERFRTGNRLNRDFGRQVAATAAGQHPLAVVLGCIDSRTPAEHIFDLGVGDVFVARVAGNVSGTKVFGSMEYACAVAGAKLIVVLGHTKCGAVRAAVELAATGQGNPTELAHLGPVLDQIRQSAALLADADFAALSDDERQGQIDRVARENVYRTVAEIHGKSDTLRRLADDGSIAVVGAMYDVSTGRVEFLTDLKPAPLPDRVIARTTEPTGAV